MVVRHGCRMLLLSCCCCYQSILLLQFRVASFRTTALVPSSTRVTRMRRPVRRPMEDCVVVRWWGSDSELRIQQSSSRNDDDDDDDESKNDTTTTELQPPGEAVPPTNTDDISNFLWSLEEQQRNRGGDMNVSGSSDLPLPFFTSVLILFGSLYVTGYGIYVGLYGFPPEGDTSFVSTLPRIF